MKFLIVILFSLFSTTVKADGLDQVTIFINGKQVKEIVKQRGDTFDTLSPLNVGDTITFKAFTDWGGLDHAWIEIRSLNEEEPEIVGYAYSILGNFRFIVIDQTYLNRDLEFILHYDNKTDMPPWSFLEIHGAD